MSRALDHPVLFENEVVSSQSNSNVPDLRSIWMFSIQAKWTVSSPVDCSLKIQVSDDGEQWDDYPDSEVDVTEDGQFTWNVFYVGFRRVRLQGNAGGGSFTVSAYIYGKGS